MYECFHCCTKGVIWDSDFSFEDFGMEGEGIVHVCHCTNCGAEIQYFVSLEKEVEASDTYTVGHNENETGVVE